jgi:hypothetical protein
MTGASTQPTATIRAVRTYREGANRVSVWFTPSGENTTATLAGLLTIPVAELEHVVQVAPRTDATGAHVVFELCAGHATKDLARLVIDTVAKRLGLSITETEFVDTTSDPSAFMAQAADEFARGVGSVLGAALSAVLRQPSSRPW